MSLPFMPFEDFDASRLGLYTLDPNRIPIPCRSLLEWAQWYEQAGQQCRVAQDFIGDGQGHWVSTIFLAIDHNRGFGKCRDPLLFETMVFDAGEPTACQRYPTWAEAAAGHERVRQMLCHEHAQAGLLSAAAIRDIVQRIREPHP